MSPFSRKEEAQKGQAVSGLAGAEERYTAYQRAHGGDPGGGRCRHGAVPRGRGCPEVHPHCHEHGESGVWVLIPVGSVFSLSSALGVGVAFSLQVRKQLAWGLEHVAFWSLGISAGRVVWVS